MNKEYREYLKEKSFIYRKNLKVTDVSFGCEIEVDGIHFIEAADLIKEFNKHLHKDELFRAVEDSTVDSEIISSVLYSTERTWQVLSEVLAYLVDNGAVTGPTVSSHLHIGTDKINTLKKFQTLIKVLCVFENIIFKYGYNFSNKPSLFHYCKSATKSTLTKIMNPEAIDKFFNEMEYEYFDDYNFCVAYDDYSLGPIRHRPVFNFRDFDYLTFIDQKEFNRYRNQIIKMYNPVHNTENHFEIRCFSGTLNNVIWQNNVDLATRIIYAINHDLIDHEYIDQEFSKYRKKIYPFYKDLQNINFIHNIPMVNHYNDFLDTYSEVDEEKATHFATMFYNIFPNDEVAYDHFNKQYYKLFTEEDIHTLIKK